MHTPHAAPSPAARWAERALWAVSAAWLLWGLGEGSLLDSDDAIYADMARTAWRSGDWLSLRWHGAVLHEKPPLLFALVGATGGALGFSDLAARLPGALTGAATIMLLPALGRALGMGRWAGIVAGGLLLASGTWVFHCRRVMADPLLVLACTAGTLAWLRATSAEREGRGRAATRLAAAAGACFGLGVLAKWVFVAIGGVSLLTWHAVRRTAPRGRLVLWAVVAGVVVAAPWHVWQSVHHGADFWQTYLGFHVVARAARSLVNPSEAGLYARVLWELDAGLVGLALVGAAGLALPGAARRGAATAAAMALAGFLPLQLSGTRMPHYLLSVLPLAALAIAPGLVALARWRRPMVPALLAAGAMATLVGPWPHVRAPDYSPGSRAACARPAPTGPPVLVVDAYSVAPTWYCGAAVPVHTSDERLAALLDSIDMTRRSSLARLAPPAAVDALVAEAPRAPVITRRGHGDRLLARGGPWRGRTVEVFADAEVLWPVASATQGRASSRAP